MPAPRELRLEELRRRVEALPKEVDAWRLSALNHVDRQLHASQMAAIAILIEVLVEEQKKVLDTLSPPPEDFETKSFALVKLINKAQRAWDFFRDKLDLRLSPKFKEVLWVADTVAWDSYSRALGEKPAAVDASAIREPPLTYLSAELSPLTWIRGSRPNDGRNYDLGTAKLPFPVIQLPWDHVENVWELATLMHEVGHDLEADLKLRIPLTAILSQKLTGANVPETRTERWIQWLGETVADLIALQLAGPAYAYTLFHLLLMPPAQVTTLDTSDPHPNHYLRMMMSSAYIPTLHAGNFKLQQDADTIRNTWVAIYGEQLDASLGGYGEDFKLVFEALMDTKLDALNGSTLRELLPYGLNTDTKIRSGASYLITGQNRPNGVRPRHWISAARLAVNDVAADAGFSAMLDQINTRAMTMVREEAPAGLRAAPKKDRARKLAETWLQEDVLAPKG